MKLKDILKTDTDNKGWLRVFKKLGADAEMLKYVNENISKSGGGGEGVKEYYYKFLLTQEMLFDMIVTMSNIALTNLLIDIKKGVTETTMIMSVENYMNNYNSILPYAKIYDIPYQYISIVDGSLINGNVYNFESGDMFDRMAKLMGVDVETVKEQYKDVIQEITKEEYESMITYKP